MLSLKYLKPSSEQFAKWLIVALVAAPIFGYGIYKVWGAVTAQKTLSSADNISGLVGHWTFDAVDMTPNVRDRSTSANHGNLSGQAATTTAIGTIGQALSFDGVDDYISVGNVGSGLQSVSFWINTSSTTQKIIDLNGSAYVEISSGTITATGFTSPTIYIDGVVTSTLTSGWHHVVITTGSTISASAVNIGKVTSYFVGTLDDVRFYNRAITASEVARLYKLGGTTKINKTLARLGDTISSGLMAHWSFDGGTVAVSGGTVQNTGFKTTTATAAVATSAGDNNGFQGTSGDTPLDTTTDNFGYITDVDSGTGTATDGCTTFPQSENDQHDFNNFGLSVPTGYVIDGIEVTTNGKVDSATGPNVFCLALSWDGGTSWTSAKSSAAFAIADTDQTDTYGSSSDTWGRIWSASEVGNANFRLRVMPDSSASNTRDYSLDFLQVKAYYSSNPTVSVTDLSGNGKTGTGTSTQVLGSLGQALNFNGTSDLVVVGNVGSGAQSVAFWINTASTTQKIIDLNGTAYIEISSGTITATGFTSPTIYIDGAVTSTLTSGWHHVVITTGTGINASAVNLGKVTSYFSGALDDVRIYSRAISSAEVTRLYLMGATTKINKTIERVGDTIESGLVGHWTFDGKYLTPNVRDRSTSANHGSLSAATTTAVGKVGQALSFNGTTDYYVNIAHASSLNFGAPGDTFSIGAWIKTASTTGAIVTKSRPTSLTHMPYNLRVVSGKVLFSRWCQGCPDSGESFSGNVTVSDNTWHYVMFVTTGASSHKIYVDGVLDTENTTTWTLTDSNTEPVYIGKYHNYTFGTTLFDGLIDDARIYNRALSADEVKRLYLMGK